jgi:acetyl-CoA synthetase
LAKESSEWVDKHDLSSLKVIGSVGEPINDEAWHWFNDHVGKKMSDCRYWWQTETGGIMISPLHLLPLQNQLMLLFLYREFSLF